MTVIRNLKDLARHLEVDTDNMEHEDLLRGIRRNLYKFTDCGAWISPQYDHLTETLEAVRVGSIVEGSDAEVEADDLEFPFTSEQWDEAVAYVEAEAALEFDSINQGDQP